MKALVAQNDTLVSFLFFLFALFIDLLTDKVQPLSRRKHPHREQERERDRDRDRDRDREQC